MPFKTEYEGKEITAYTEEEVQAKVDSEVSGLKAKNQELLDEKRKAKEKADEIEAERLRKEEELARENGDFKKLLETQQERAKQLEEQHQNLMRSVKNEKVENALNGIVQKVEPVSGTHAEDLKDLLKARYDFDYSQEDGKVIVNGENIRDIDSLLKEVKESGRYDYFLAGTKAQGGGATGANSGAGNKNLNEMTEAERVELYKTDPDKFRELANRN